MKIDYEKFIETKEPVRIDSEFSLYFNPGLPVFDQQIADWIRIPAIEVWNEIEKYSYISIPLWVEDKEIGIEVAKKAIKMLKCLSKYYEDLE